MAFALLIFLSAGLLDCRCSEKPKGSEPDKANVVNRVETSLDDEVVAIVRISNLDVLDTNFKSYMSTLDESPDGVERPTLRFRNAIVARMDVAADQIRWDGAFDLLVFKSESLEELRWTLLVPVTSAKEAVQVLIGPSADFASEGGGVVHEWQMAGETLFTLGESLVLSEASSADRKERLVISNFALGTYHAKSLIEKLVPNPPVYVGARLWPRRTGIADRYALMAKLFEDRIASAGHDLLPARAGVARLQARLYAGLADADNWPEVVDVDTLFKVRSGAVKRFGASLTFVPVEGTNVAALAEGIGESGHRGIFHPKDARAILSLGAKRDRWQELYDGLMPKSLRRLLILRHEGNARKLDVNLQRVLEHNRGATTIAFYPQEVPLTGEVLIGFDVMDADELPKKMEIFQDKLLTYLIMPLFMADPGAIKHQDFSYSGMVGQSAYFELADKKKSRVGVCWGLREKKFFASVGVNPCARLKTDFGDPFPAGGVHLETTLSELLDLVYMPMRTSLGSDEVVVSWSVVPPREDAVTIETVFRDPSQLARLFEIVEKLPAFWNPVLEIDPALIALQVGGEQALYQEPGLMIVGPPGLLGALPPAYFLGMPFSVTPVPPSQIRAVFIEPDSREEKEQEK
jgi:hypothetical protein